MNRGIIGKVLLVIMILFLGVSVYFNVRLYTSYVPPYYSAEKRFLDMYQNEIDRISLKDGTKMEGIVQEETTDAVIVRTAIGATSYKRAWIEKILYDIYSKGGQNGTIA